MPAGHSKLPSFDHNLKDPVEDDIEVSEHHRVVIVEGNYLHLGEWLQQVAFKQARSAAVQAFV